MLESAAKLEIVLVKERKSSLPPHHPLPLYPSPPRPKGSFQPATPSITCVIKEQEVPTSSSSDDKAP